MKRIVCGKGGWLKDAANYGMDYFMGINKGALGTVTGGATNQFFDQAHEKMYKNEDENYQRKHNSVYGYSEAGGAAITGIVSENPSAMTGVTSGLSMGISNTGARNMENASVYKKGGIVKYQEGGKVNPYAPTPVNWNGDTKPTTPSNVFTYENNPGYFDNKAAYSDNPAYNEQIRKGVYSGNFGYDPKTGTLHKLDKPVPVPKKIKELANQKGPADPAELFKNDPELRKKYIQSSTEDAFKNPLMYAPGTIGMAALPIGFGSAYGFAQAAGEAMQGNNKTAALWAGLSALPFAAPALRGIKAGNKFNYKSFSQNTNLNIEEVRSVYHNNNRFLTLKERKLLRKHGVGLPDNYKNNQLPPPPSEIRVMPDGSMRNIYNQQPITDYISGSYSPDYIDLRRPPRPSQRYNELLLRDDYSNLVNGVTPRNYPNLTREQNIAEQYLIRTKNGTTTKSNIQEDIAKLEKEGISKEDIDKFIKIKDKTKSSITDGTLSYSNEQLNQHYNLLDKELLPLSDNIDNEIKILSNMKGKLEGNSPLIKDLTRRLEDLHSTKFLRGTFIDDITERGFKPTMKDMSIVTSKGGTKYLLNGEGKVLGNMSIDGNYVGTSAVNREFHGVHEIGKQNQVAEALYRGIHHGINNVRGTPLQSHGHFATTSFINPKTGLLEETKRAENWWESKIPKGIAKKENNTYTILKTMFPMGLGAAALHQNETSKYAKGGIVRYGEGGPVKKQVPPAKKPNAPLYVNDPNDPRLKAYQDSLFAFLDTGNQLRFHNKQFGTKMPINKPATWAAAIMGLTYNELKNEYNSNKNKPIGFQSYQYGSDELEKLKKAPSRIRDTDAIVYSRGSTNPIGVSVPIFKKPVQPVVYQAKKEVPVVNKIKDKEPTIDMSVPGENYKKPTEKPIYKPNVKKLPITTPTLTSNSQEQVIQGNRKVVPPIKKYDIVTYTGGGTGIPKGYINEPGNLYNKSNNEIPMNPVKFKHGGSVNGPEGDLISKVIMNRNKDKDFVQRANAVGSYPNSNMFSLPDPENFGSKMSHKMVYGEDDNGQSYMYPTIMNPGNEAIKVPNQYANYISSEGYKKATNMYKNGGTVNKVQINVEGNELRVDPTNLSVITDYKGLPKHPDNPNFINPQGNVTANEGDVIVPKDMRDRFLNSDYKTKQRMITTLKYRIPETKFQTGGVITRPGDPYQYQNVNGTWQYRKPNGTWKTMKGGTDILNKEFPQGATSTSSTGSPSFSLNPKVAYANSTLARGYGGSPNTPYTAGMYGTPPSPVPPLNKGIDRPDVSTINDTRPGHMPDSSGVDKPFDDRIPQNKNTFEPMNTKGYQAAAIGSGIASAYSGIDYLLKHRSPYKTTFNRATANHLDPTEAIKGVNSAYGSVNYGLRNLGTAGYLSNRIESGSRQASDIAKTRMDYDNANAQIDNNFSQFNTQISNSEIEANERNRDTYEMGRKQAMDQIAGAASGATKDAFMYKQEGRKVDYMNQMGLYKVNKKGQIVLRTEED